MDTTKETASMTKEAQYEKAVSTYTYTVKEEEFALLRDIFKELGDYKNAAAYLKKCENYLAHSLGATVAFGNYNGKEILWKVLRKDGYRCLLLAKEPVDFRQYHSERVNITWSTCALRKWLNKQFVEEAFSFQERMSIMLMLHRNDTDPRWDRENGPDTKDKVFIFNKQELDEYLPRIEDRAIHTWWWLRGHGCSNLNQQAVYNDGTVYENGVSSNSSEPGVLPAMWIRLK